MTVALEVFLVMLPLRVALYRACIRREHIDACTRGQWYTRREIVI